MQYRTLGRSNLRVPVITFGAWVIGGTNWGGTDDDVSVRAIQAAIDGGMTAIDTAPVYGFGHSERIVGRAIRGRRDEVVLMTKVGLRWDDVRGDFFFETEDNNGQTMRVHKNCRPWSVKAEVEWSLRRLGVDVIDLIQVHWNDPKTPIAETMGALLELRAAGKVREIGVSNYSAQMIAEAQRALGDVPLSSDQPKYNLVAREIEKEILPWCRAQGVGVLAYSPLEQGLLTGKVSADRAFPATDGRYKRTTFTAENRARVNALLANVVQPIAAAHGAHGAHGPTVGQVVLAWTVAQPGITSAIAGARTPEQARDNAAAGDLVLDASELSKIRAAFEGLTLAMPAGAMVRGRLRNLVRRLIGRG